MALSDGNDVGIVGVEDVSLKGKMVGLQGADDDASLVNLNLWRGEEKINLHSTVMLGIIEEEKILSCEEGYISSGFLETRVAKMN